MMKKLFNQVVFAVLTFMHLMSSYADAENDHLTGISQQYYEYCHTQFENKAYLYEQSREWKQHLTQCIKSCKQLRHAIKFKNTKDTQNAPFARHYSFSMSSLETQCRQGHDFIVKAQESNTSDE